MEWRSSVGDSTVFRLVMTVAVLALITMHAPPAIASAPSNASHSQAMTSSHISGSACRTLHEEPISLPALPGGPKVAVSVRDDLAPLFNGPAPATSDRTILSIWRI